MRIFLAGDHVTGTGPANVTARYIQNLPAGTLYQKRKSKAGRAFEIAVNTLRSDVVVYSGYSKQNLLGLRLARILKKPSAYLMHGCVEYENEINLEPDEEMSRVERSTLMYADLIIAVSESFCSWLKERYPMHEHKTVCVANGIDEDLYEAFGKRADVDPHMILSVGGGMPRKKIRYICEAVGILRREYDPLMYLCVTGDKGADTDVILSYDFADVCGIVSFDEQKELFMKASVFVQNSCFETFGLAPIEALCCGCPVLCSKEVGALGLISTTDSGDVIDNCEDPEEIAEKIKHILESPNAGRLLDGIDIKRYSWKERSQALVQLLSELVLKK